nr:FAD-binding oxidoreductase [uncultured Gellertiella sp.]
MRSFADPVWSESVTEQGMDTSLPPSGRLHDLLIVGGGFLGLSAALHAARAGRSVLVLEAGRLGAHASGLNGGQVIPGLKYDPEWLLRHYGERRGEAVTGFAAGTADAVFDLIVREGLAVPHVRAGWIQACHTEKAIAAATERHRQWRALGADVALLDAEEIQARIGTCNYLGGFFDRRAGTINPLALQLELARIARAAGAMISEGQACLRLEGGDGDWRAVTQTGATLRARKVLVATNAYSDRLIPGLAQSLIPLHSLQIATAPLGEALASRILPGQQCVSDSRRILVYYRKTATGRLILGGRGPMRLPRGEGDWAHLERAMRRLFPVLAGVAIDKRWFGRVAVTADHLPHLHQPAAGLLAMAGCQGRGVGMMVAAGPRLADYLFDADPGHLPLPLSPIVPIPFHRFRKVGVAGLIAWYRMLDAFER